MAGTRNDKTRHTTRHATRTVTGALVLGAALLVPPVTGAGTTAVAAPAPSASAPAPAAAKTPPVKPFEKRPI